MRTTILFCIMAALAAGNLVAQDRLRTYLVGEVTVAYLNSTDGSARNSGAANLNMDLEETIAPGLTLGGGIEWNDILATELTWTYLPAISMDVDSYDVNGTGFPGITGELEMASHLFMVGNRINVMPAAKTVKPYIGVGIGMALHDVDSLDYGDSSGTVEVDGDTSTDFAWSLGLGVDFALSEAVALTIAYEYVDAGTAETGRDFKYLGITGELDEPFDFDMSAHVLSLGLTWRF